MFQCLHVGYIDWLHRLQVLINKMLAQ